MQHTFSWLRPPTSLGKGGGVKGERLSPAHYVLYKSNSTTLIAFLCDLVWCIENNEVSWPVARIYDYAFTDTVIINILRVHMGEYLYSARLCDTHVSGIETVPGGQCPYMYYRLPPVDPKRRSCTHTHTHTSVFIVIHLMGVTGLHSGLQNLDHHGAAAHCSRRSRYICSGIHSLRSANNI